MPKPSEVDRHYSEAVRLALDIVRERARKILRRHKNLDEFVMAMGGWFFTSKHGEHISDKAYTKPVSDFIDEWDSYLRLTGVPMRFTAEGKEITDW